MNPGIIYRSGDVLLANVQFTDTFEVKKRPVLVLFEEYDNIVVAGITSNPEMKGIVITTKDGAIKRSVIKLNYIFTISAMLVEKKLFSLNSKKRKEVHSEIIKKLSSLNNN